MKRIMRNLVSPDVFKAVVLTMSLLGVCPLVAESVEPFLKLLHLYAAAVLVCDLWGEQRILRNQGRWVLVVFVPCCVVTLLCNRNLLNFSDLSNCCYLLETLAVLYSYGRSSEKWNGAISLVVCTLLALANVVGIVTFFTKFCLHVPGRGYVGIYPYENRLAGLFGNPNVLGMICLGAICLGLIQLVRSDRRGMRVYYGVLCLIHLVTLLLSNSRTQLYSLIFLGAVLTFLLGIRGKRGAKAIFRAALASAMCVVLIFGGFRLAQHGMSMLDVNYTYYELYVSNEYEKDTDDVILDEDLDETKPSQPQKPGKTEKPTDTIARHEDEDLNGRLVIWKQGLRLIAAKPLFGCGMDNANETLSQLGYAEIPVKGNLHNAYLEVLAAFGLAGFVCLVLFALVLLRNAIVFLRTHSRADWMQGAVCLACAMAFLMDGLADSTLLASLYPTAVMFWMVLSELARVLDTGNQACGQGITEPLSRLADKWKRG